MLRKAISYRYELCFWHLHVVDRNHGWIEIFRIIYGSVCYGVYVSLYSILHNTRIHFLMFFITSADFKYKQRGVVGFVRKHKYIVLLLAPYQWLLVHTSINSTTSYPNYI